MTSLIQSPSPSRSGGEGRVRGMVTPRRRSERTSQATNRSRARDMRHTPVATEKLFWSEVRNRKLGGFKFKRQVLIGPYIVDFVCQEKKLVVELDGKLHDGRVAYDAARDEFLKRQGFRVLRFQNNEFLNDAGIVLATIQHELETPSPNPLPQIGGEGGG